MQVAFVHAEGPYRAEELELQRALAHRMMDSVREHIGCNIVHLADPMTPDLGADETVRGIPESEYWVPFVLRMFGLMDGETLFLDTDCIVQRDVSDVFTDQSFDVALTVKRKRFAQYVDPQGVKHYMPFSMGVVFSRAPAFWLMLAERVERMTGPMMLGWWGAQIELLRVYANPGAWRIKVLESDEFNYTPNAEGEDVSGRAIVHYKGVHRKHWAMPGFAPLPEKRIVELAAGG